MSQRYVFAYGAHSGPHKIAVQIRLSLTCYVLLCYSLESLLYASFQLCAFSRNGTFSQRFANDDAHAFDHIWMLDFALNVTLCIFLQIICIQKFELPQRMRQVMHNAPNARYFQLATLGQRIVDHFGRSVRNVNLKVMYASLTIWS